MQALKNKMYTLYISMNLQVIVTTNYIVTLHVLITLHVLFLEETKSGTENTTRNC